MPKTARVAVSGSTGGTPPPPCGCLGHGVVDELLIAVPFGPDLLAGLAGQFPGGARKNTRERGHGGFPSARRCRSSRRAAGRRGQAEAGCVVLAFGHRSMKVCGCRGGSRPWPGSMYKVGLAIPAAAATAPSTRRVATLIERPAASVITSARRRRPRSVRPPERAGSSWPRSLFTPGRPGSPWSRGTGRRRAVIPGPLAGHGRAARASGSCGEVWAAPRSTPGPAPEVREPAADECGQFPLGDGAAGRGHERDGNARPSAHRARPPRRPRVLRVGRETFSTSTEAMFSAAADDTSLLRSVSSI